MSFSVLLTGIVIGAAGVEFVRECMYWRRLPSTVTPVEPPSMDDLMLESTKARSELTRIEAIVRDRIGARPDSDEADVVLHAVRDGHDWQAVLNLERDYLCGGGFSKQRVARWV